MAAEFDVFLSHNSRDKKVVREIGEKLKRRRLVPWLDEWELRPGRRWQKELEKATERCAGVAVFVGPDGLGPWEESEMEVFLDRAMRDEEVSVIPVLLPGAPEKVELRPFLKLYKWVDLREGVTEQGLDRLEFGITGRKAGSRAAEPTFPRLHNLPFHSLGDGFKGRREDLEGLAKVLEADPAAVIAQPQTLSGLGGIGKTRLAVEYAWRYGERYGAVFFSRADSEARLHQGLARLAEPDVLGLGLKGRPEPEVVGAVRAWLRQNPGWLLILDNVDDEEAQRAVRELLPLTGGHVLVTSRLDVWPKGIQRRRLDRLERGDSVALLLDSTADDRPHRDDDAGVADRIAEELGDLPLALELAAAYVGVHSMPLAAYLDEWRRRREHVLSWHDEAATAYPRAIAVTWNHSFDRLALPAQALLRLLAHLAADPLPPGLAVGAGKAVAEGVGLLEEEGEQRTVGTDDDEDRAPVRAEKSRRSGFFGSLGRLFGRRSGRRRKRQVDAGAALAELRRYSLLQSGDGQTTVHRMVQEVVRNRIPEPRRAAWAERAVRMVLDFAPDEPGDVRTWPVWDPLRPHAERVIELALAAGAEMPTSNLMGHLGTLLYFKSLHSEAEPLMRRALDIDQQAFGEQHPTVAIRLNNLAQLLKATNRLQEAEPLMRRALDIDQQAFGEQHPNVAIRLNNLAALLRDTNRLQEAEPLMIRALDINQQTFGEQHPTVAIRLNNLAQLLKATNRLQEAEPLMRRALDIDQQAFGEQHPRIAAHLNNLAQLLQDTNRLQEAEPLMRRALDIDQQALGEQHPNVAIRLNNLARLLHDTNRPQEAEPLMRRSLAIVLDFTRRHGHEHPHLQVVLGNYRRLLAALGKTEDEIATALAELRREVEDQPL